MLEEVAKITEKRKGAIDSGLKSRIEKVVSNSEESKIEFDYVAYVFSNLEVYDELAKVIGAAKINSSLIGGVMSRGEKSFQARELLDLLSVRMGYIDIGQEGVNYNSNDWFSEGYSVHFTQKVKEEWDDFLTERENVLDRFALSR